MSYDDFVAVLQICIVIIAWCALGFLSCWLNDRIMPSQFPGQFAPSEVWERYNRNLDDVRTMTFFSGPLWGLVVLVGWLIVQTIKFLFRGIAWLAKRASRTNVLTIA